MTREEALSIATGLRTDFKCESNTMVEFCNTVIEALSAGPCEDAVSRKAVLKTLCDVCPVYDCIYKAYSDNVGCSQFNKIRSLPSVQLYGGDAE